MGTAARSARYGVPDGLYGRFLGGGVASRAALGLHLSYAVNGLRPDRPRRARRGFCLAFLQGFRKLLVDQCVQCRKWNTLASGQVDHGDFAPCGKPVRRSSSDTKCFGGVRHCQQ